MAEKAPFTKEIPDGSLIVATFIALSSYDIDTRLEFFKHLRSVERRLINSHGLIDYGRNIRSEAEYMALSAWSGEESMNVFRDSARHREAMEAGESLGMVATAKWFYDSEQDITWKDARERIGIGD